MLTDITASAARVGVTAASVIAVKNVDLSQLLLLTVRVIAAAPGSTDHGARTAAPASRQSRKQARHILLIATTALPFLPLLFLFLFLFLRRLAPGVLTLLFLFLFLRSRRLLFALVPSLLRWLATILNLRAPLLWSGRGWPLGVTASPLR